MGNFLTNQVVQCTFNYTNVVLIFVLFTWFFLRRKIFPISGRAPILMYAVGIFLGLSELNESLPNNSIPCDFTAWIGVLTVNSCVILYTQRAWILLFRFEITENLYLLNQMKQSGLKQEEIKKNENWFLRNRHRMRSSQLILWLCIDYICQIIFLTLTTIFDPSKKYSCLSSDSSVLSIYYNNYMLGCRGILVIILAWKLRSKGYDNLLFKSELKWIGCLQILNFLVPTILRLVYPSIPWVFWARMISTIAIFWPGILRPLKLSYEEENRRKNSSEINLNNLRSILNQEIGFKSFLDFLATEFSTENLLCWRDVNEWVEMVTICFKENDSKNSSTQTEEKNHTLPSRTSMTSSKIKLYHRAIEIYEQYIDEINATSQINVPPEIRSQIRSELELVGVKLTSLSTPTDPPSSPEIIIRPEHTERRSTTPEPLSPEPLSTTQSSELLPFLQSNDTLFEDLVQSYVGLEKKSLFSNE